MRIAIIGAGAIGGTLGALLKRAGQDVVLVGRSDQAAAIRKSGLQIDGCLGTFSIEIEVVERLTSKPDLALLAVKTQDVVSAVQDNSSWLGNVPLVTLQNGVRSDEQIAEMLPKSQLLGAIVLSHATYLMPGKVTVAHQGSVIVGRPFGPNDQEVDKLARVLSQVLPTHISANLRGARWLKLIVNLNNALPAVTNHSVREIYDDLFLGQLATRAMREGLWTVADAHIKLESLPEVSVNTARLITRLPLGIATRVAASKARNMEKGWPLLGSTLQSIRRGRPTEIDFLNGEIVKLGVKINRPTPINQKLMEWVHRVEHDRQYLSSDVLRDEFDVVVSHVA